MAAPGGGGGGGALYEHTQGAHSPLLQGCSTLFATQPTHT
jgi:hypothetical protein